MRREAALPCPAVPARPPAEPQLHRAWQTVVTIRVPPLATTCCSSGSRGQAGFLWQSQNMRWFVSVWALQVPRRPNTLLEGWAPGSTVLPTCPICTPAGRRSPSSTRTLWLLTWVTAQAASLCRSTACSTAASSAPRPSSPSSCREALCPPSWAPLPRWVEESAFGLLTARSSGPFEDESLRDRITLAWICLCSFAFLQGLFSDLCEMG